MMKKFFALLLFCFASVQAIETLPQKFTVTEKWISLTTAFYVESMEREHLGNVYRKFFSFLPNYVLEAPSGERLAEGRMRLEPLPILDIVDRHGNPYGRVEQRFSWIYPYFHFHLPSGKLVAEGTLNFWGTCFTITDPRTNEPLAYMSRPYFWFKSDWTVEILDEELVSEKGLHPHMFLTLVAFQTDYEYWEKRVNNQSDNQAKSLPSATFACYSSQLESAFTPDPNFVPNNRELKKTEKLVSQLLPVQQIHSKEEWAHCFEKALDLLQSEDLTPIEKENLFLLLKTRLEKESTKGDTD